MTKRAREHAGLVLALKAYKHCYRANGPGVSGPRWRAYRTEREKEMRRWRMNRVDGALSTYWYELSELIFDLEEHHD